MIEKESLYINVDCYWSLYVCHFDSNLRPYEFHWFGFPFGVMSTSDAGHSTKLNAPFKGRYLKSITLLIVDVQATQAVVDW